MKISLAKLFAMLLVTASGLFAYAATPTTFNVMNINRTDGETERLLIDTNLDITMSENGSLLLVHPEITVEYQLEEVDNITFERDTDFTGTYEGDHQSGIETPVMPEEETTISVTTNEIQVFGGKDLQLFDLKGVKIATRQAEGGVATLSTSSLPKGVYIIKAGNSTLKVKL